MLKAASANGAGRQENSIQMWNNTASIVKDKVMSKY